MKVLIFTAAFLALASVASANECGQWCEKSFWKTATPEGVAEHIESGADVSSPIYSGFPALPLAVALSEAPVVQVLIDAGADVNATVQYGLSPLMVAFKFKNLEVVPLLLAAGTKADVSTDNGETALSWAFIGYKNHPENPLYNELISLLLKAGGHTGSKADLLVSMAGTGDADLVRLALDAGADPNARSSDGIAPLVASGSNKTTIVQRMLLEAGADISSRDDHNTNLRLEDSGADVLVSAGNGWTVLHRAAIYGTPETIQFLISVGADIQARDKEGETPLHTAAYAESGENIRALLAAGADIEARAYQNVTPLLRAAFEGSFETVKALVEAGPDVNTRAEDQRTPIFGAVDLTADTYLLELLIEAGADVNASDVRGLRPLHEAARWAKEDHIRILLAAGADVNVRNKEGRTPLDMTTLG